MKNARFERLGRMQRQYHRSHPWRLSAQGLFVPHAYPEADAGRLSWWDDVGFILNGRRVMVWWLHPRQDYADELEQQAELEVGKGPQDGGLLANSTKNYRRLGTSRKKVVSYTLCPQSADRQLHYERLDAVRERLQREGTDHAVRASWRRKRLAWAIGVNLVAPLEVRNEQQLAVLARLVRRLLLGQTTLAAEFPDYCYSRADWLREQGGSAGGAASNASNTAQSGQPTASANPGNCS